MFMIVVLLSLVGAATANPCDSSPCPERATCTEIDNGYNCTCLPNYNGINCEYARICHKEMIDCPKLKLLNVPKGCTCQMTACTGMVYGCTGWCPSSSTPVSYHSATATKRPSWQERCTCCKPKSYITQKMHYHCTCQCMCGAPTCDCPPVKEYDIVVPYYSATDCTCKPCRRFIPGFQAVAQRGK